MKKLTALSFLIFLFFLPVWAFAQEPATFFLSPQGGSFNVGEEFDVELRVASPESITSLKAYLNFDPKLLSIVNIDTSASDFPFWWEKKQQEGQVQLQASVFSPGLQAGLISKIKMKALAVGPASLAYDGSSLALAEDDENLLSIKDSSAAQFQLWGRETGQERALTQGLFKWIGAIILLAGAAIAGFSIVSKRRLR